jgi:hypothetical protein
MQKVRVLAHRWGFRFGVFSETELPMYGFQKTSYPKVGRKRRREEIE